MATLPDHKRPPAGNDRLHIYKLPQYEFHRLESDTSEYDASESDTLESGTKTPLLACPRIISTIRRPGSIKARIEKGIRMIHEENSRLFAELNSVNTQSGSTPDQKNVTSRRLVAELETNKAMVAYHECVLGAEFLDERNVFKLCSDARNHRRLRLFVDEMLICCKSVTSAQKLSCRLRLSAPWGEVGPSEKATAVLNVMRWNANEAFARSLNAMLPRRDL